MASTTPGALGRTAVTVTTKLVLVADVPSETVSVIVDEPARPSAGVMRSVHAPLEVQDVESADGLTGRSAVLDEAMDTRSADTNTLPAMVNGTLIVLFCGIDWLGMLVIVGGGGPGVGGGVVTPAVRAKARPMMPPVTPIVFAGCSRAGVMAPVPESNRNVVRFRLLPFAVITTWPDGSTIDALLNVPPVANGEPGTWVSVVPAPRPLMRNTATLLEFRAVAR